MSLKNKAWNYIQREVLKRIDDRAILVESAIRRGTDSPSKTLEYEAVELTAKTIKDLKTAIALATDPKEPDFQPLASLYSNLLLDQHLSSIIDTRVLYSQRSKFKMVDEKDKENTEISWLLERPWMRDLIRMVITHQFEGTKLLEFFDLTPEGELKQITEIPRGHFNTRKGIITKTSGATTGWSYREGPFAQQYVQIGKDDELGMLSQMAIVILAKKLGFGAFLDYIDKFGVPPIFVTTDREDDTRLKELFNAASNFKRNHFMVGKGQEKFEIGNIGGTGVAPHEKLIQICNDELSKRVLGGAGLTDQKAFVGSADIQFTLAKDRFEADKTLFEYVFNMQIKPVLVNLSPVYAPLANHYFKWDNTESLTQLQIIDTIQKFGSLYDIDPEYITQVTGIPILGIKQNAPIAPNPSGGGDGKKK
jgi:hypothetical protein